jgi:hypothetical protein
MDHANVMDSVGDEHLSCTHDSACYPGTGPCWTGNTTPTAPLPRVHDEDGPNGARVVGSRLHHTILAGRHHFQVGNDREGDLLVLHPLVLDLLLDRSQPSDVAEVAVDRQADQLAVQCLELRHQRGRRSGTRALDLK